MMYKKALIGTVLVAALSMSANLSGAAVKLPAAKQQVKITMSLRGMKLEIPNCVALGLPDCAVFGIAPFSYQLTVYATVNGKPMTGNEGMQIVTSDRAEPELCGITSSKSNADWCNIDFPNPGRFTIAAEYGPDYWNLDASGPSRKSVTATKKLVVKFYTCNSSGSCWY